MNDTDIFNRFAILLAERSLGEKAQEAIVRHFTMIDELGAANRRTRLAAHAACQESFADMLAALIEEIPTCQKALPAAVSK